jgi:hypothetical protein
MPAERPEQWRAVAKIVAASLLFAVALARAVAFRPAEPRDLGLAVAPRPVGGLSRGPRPPDDFRAYFSEAEILDAATTACVAHNGTWFARRERGILALKDDRQGDYCEVIIYPTPACEERSFA